MTDEEIEDAVERVQSAASDECAPGKMSPPEARDFYERCMHSHRSSIEGLTDDIGDRDEYAGWRI